MPPRALGLLVILALDLLVAPLAAAPPWQHPEHGAAVIEELKDKEFLGEKRKYLVLRVVYGDLTLSVPVDSAEQVGLRPVISKPQVKKILKVLTEAETIWLTTQDGRVAPGHALAYDFETGFGLIQALGRLREPIDAAARAHGHPRG